MHLSLTDTTHDSRVRKESQSILEGTAARVLVIELWRPGTLARERLVPAFEVLRVRLRSRPLPLWLASQLIKYLELLVRVLGIVRVERPSVLHAHSLPALPISVVAKWVFGCSLVYDAHELEAHRNGLRGLRLRLARITERLLIGYADQVLVVSDSIADWYRTHYRMERPVVIRNLPLAASARETEESPLRKRAGVDSKDFIFLYLGMLGRGRSIELMCRAFTRVDPTRHLVLQGSGELEPVVREYAMRYPNIHLLTPVPLDEVGRSTRGADVGLCLIESVCLSYELSLPNKMFQCLFESVPVLINDLPEQSRFVRQFQCGWITPPGESGLSGLVQSIDRKSICTRRDGARRVSQTLSWEADVVPYVEFCRAVMHASRSEA